MEYAYNANGAMTKDLNKGITNISYNLLNLPQQIDINNPFAVSTNKYSYSAGGVKLRVVKRYNSNFNTSPVIGSAVNTSKLNVTQTTDYVAGKIFENNVLDRVFVDGGYIKNGVYYFYETDHLGSNRTVINQSGTVVERNDYYPYGMQMGHNDPNKGLALLTDGSAKTAFKFSGKELDVMHGLNLYDSQARWYDPCIPILPTVDPLAEKYYSWSPYAYCADNPVNAIDINGDTITTMIDGQSYHYGAVDGTYGFINSKGNLYSGDNSYANSLARALNDLQAGGNAGNTLVSNLMSSTNSVEIGMPQGVKGNGADMDKGSYILWNPNNTNGGFNTLGNETRPAFIGLGHEMAHVQDIWSGTVNRNLWPGETDIYEAEKYATNLENQLRAENQIALRMYSGVMQNEETGARSPNLNTQLIDRNGKSLYYKTYYYYTLRFNGNELRLPVIMPRNIIRY